MNHEELPDLKKVWKLNRLQHEVLHIYVHAYSAYKNKILRIHIVTIHTFIKMDLKTHYDLFVCCSDGKFKKILDVFCLAKL